MDIRLTTEDIDRIEGEAAEWVLVMNEGSLSDDTLARWRQWIEASPHHMDIYEKMLNLWSIADGLPEQGRADLTQENSMQENTKADVVTLRVKRRRWLWQGMAAAAVLVLAITVLLPTTEQIPAISIGGVSGLQTAHSEHRNHRLPDGSKIELGANSRVELDYSKDTRRVVLHKGEALFDVAKDPERPFIVTAGAGQYQALGTVFNVELLKNRSTLIVSEGVVQARLQNSDNDYNGSNYPRLVAGESVSVTADGLVGDVEKVNLDLALSWQKGQLVFVDQPLAEVFERVNRYRGKRVIVTDDAKEMRYTGSVRVDSIDDLLNVLPEVFQVKVVHESEAVYISPI